VIQDRGDDRTLLGEGHLLVGGSDPLRACQQLVDGTGAALPVQEFSVKSEALDDRPAGALPFAESDLLAAQGCREVIKQCLVLVDGLPALRGGGIVSV
jgi:hypothetical protein